MYGVTWKGPESVAGALLGSISRGKVAVLPFCHRFWLCSCGFSVAGALWVQFPVAKALFCLSATGFGFALVAFLWQGRILV